MRYKYLTQAPYDAHPLKTTPISNEIDLNYLRYLALERAQHEWVLAHERMKPTAINTCNDLKQSLLSTVGVEICRCMAFSDGAGYALTSNALRYWRTFTWPKAIPSATTVQADFKIGGLIGSIASYVCIEPQANNSDLDDRARIDTLLDAVWKDLNMTRELLPAARLDALLATLNFDSSYIQAVSIALIKYGVTGVPELRGYALDQTAVRDLGLRLLLGEVADPLISVWARLQVACNQDADLAATYGMPRDSYQKPFHLLQMGLAVGRGGGWALLLQTIYLEALLAIADILVEFEDRDLTSFTSDLTTAVPRQQLALYYAAAADTQSILGAFGTIATARDTAAKLWTESQRWAGTLVTHSAYPDPGWRLASVISHLIDPL